MKEGCLICDKEDCSYWSDPHGQYALNKYRRSESDNAALRAKLEEMKAALELTIAQLEFLPTMFTEMKDCNEPTLAIARAALKELA